MIFSVDHVVLAATEPQSREIRGRLASAGFQPRAFGLEFPEIGAASDSVSYAGGGFVELVVALEPSRAPHEWFSEVPRVIGLGFGSDDFARDTTWASEPGGWAMDEDHVLPGGEVLNIRAAGPHPHLSDLYVFVMDRPNGELEFPDHTEGPRLRRLLFSGIGALRWREDLERWLDLPPHGRGLKLGGVELEFTEGSSSTVRVSATFGVTSDDGSIPLSSGVIELVAGPRDELTI